MTESKPLPIHLEISSLKSMMGKLDPIEKSMFRDLFQILKEDFGCMRDMNSEATNMLRGIFPWTRDVSEMSHRASLRTTNVANHANERATLMVDLLESVK